MSSCKKNITGVPTSQISLFTDDVYIAGGLQSTQVYTCAVYWKNNKPTILKEGPRASIAYDLVVNNDKVYAVGNYFDANYNEKPVLWSNGVEKQLPIYETKGEAKSVFVYNGKTYVVGFATTGNFTKGKLWIDGEALDAPWLDGNQDTISSKFNAVFVENNKVYIAGKEIKGNQYRVKYWVYEPGNSSKLPPLSSAQSFLLNTCSYDLCDARSIAVKSSHVYVVGDSGNSSSTLWVDGVPTTLDTDLSVGYSVFLDNNKVYAAGTKGDIKSNKAWSWENGKLNFLDKGEADIIHARSIAKGESNVYVAGYSRKNQDDWATLWINGTPQTLVPNFERSWAYKVVTVRKIKNIFK